MLQRLKIGQNNLRLLESLVKAGKVQKILQLKLKT